MNEISRNRLLWGVLCILVPLIILTSVVADASNEGDNLNTSTQLHAGLDMSLKSAPLPARKPTSDAGVIEVAMALPEDMSPPSYISDMTSKNIFSDRQARLYREIFILQDIGDIKSANNKISRLNNTLLMGHVLAERYLHPTAYKASFKELAAWLDQYADHPQAAQIYKLALAKKPISFNVKNLKKPVSYKSLDGNLVARSKQGKLYISDKKRSPSERARAQKLYAEIKNHVDHRQPTLAMNVLSTDYGVQFMDDVEKDRLRATIAAGYLYAGKQDQALKISSEALDRSGAYVPHAGWVEGLVYWQKQDYKKSAQAFEAAATSPYASGWMVSAAAYWASRANMRSGNVELVSKWLELSATYPRTFYGLIAARALGHDTDFDWSIPELTRSHIRFIEGTDNGKRAAALIRVGRVHLAEEELRNINTARSVKKQEALLAYASHYQLPALSMQLGNVLTNKSGGLYDAALYPVTGWQPSGGYRIDRALIHAIVRQESRFHANAYNPSGATGLMQLMPKTASYIADNPVYADKKGQYKLLNPAVNLEIGQKYVEQLLNNREVGQDLLSLAVAYNAGPGNLAHWKNDSANVKDPLLFIETIPFNETRAFVERVLSNYWIYRMRLGQETPSLDAVAEGKWARYMPQDRGSAKLAMAE